MNAQQDISALEAEYKAKSSVANALLGEMQVSLTRLLQSEKIDISIPVHGRVKSWASILEKFSRRGIQVMGIDELQDLVGVRIVVQFQRDLPLVKELLWRNFQVVHSEDTAERLQADQFGYASNHFLVRPYHNGAVPMKYGRMGAEVQVRTAAQHIWASASHVLQYKHESDVPPDFRRALSRISAFLESSDLEFERLLNERARHARERASTQPANETVLSVELLEAFLDTLLPRNNKSVQDDYGPLLRELAAHNITTAGALRELVSKQLENAVRYDHEIADVERARIARHGITITALDAPVQMRTAQGAFATHVGLVRVMIAFEFNPRYRQIIDALA
jgi:putative GTP pyrophosphokinase